MFRHPDAVRSLAAWRLAVTLLEAAGRLDPTDTRFPLMRADALFQIAQPDAAAEALNDYLKLQPDDQVARLRLIEHYASKMQADDAKLTYFNSLLDRPTVSNEVKSRVATWAAQLLLQRSYAQSAAMLSRAIQLDELNIYARRLEYQFVLANGGSEARVQSLLAQLRCNPSQPSILMYIGRELASAGLSREANIWYGRSLNIALQTATPVEPRFLIDYASLLFMEGFPKQADQLLGLLLQLDPRNTEAVFMRLTVRRAIGQVVAFEANLDEAKPLFVGRIVALATELAKREAGASTQPSDASEPPPAGSTTRPNIDFSSGFSSGGNDSRVPSITRPQGGGQPPPTATLKPGDRILPDTVARLLKPDADPYLKSEFLEAVEQMAWFEIFFNKDQESATYWVEEALAKLVPANDSRLIRLQGWLAKMRGEDALAMKTLWPIRKTDAMAAMAVADLLYKGNWGAAQPAGAATKPTSRPVDYDPDLLVQRLLDEHPSGVMAAMLAEHYNGRKIFPRARPWAESLRKQVDAFPQDLIDIVIRPDKFYYPSGEPVKTPSRIGEPILAKMYLKNASAYDLPIGPEGVIKPDVWIGCRVTLAKEMVFPYAGSARLSGPLVLRANQIISQVVRVDQGPVSEALRERPSASVDVNVTLTTNPQIGPDQMPVPGPAGVRREFSRSLIRAGAPVGTEEQRRKLFASVSEGLPSEKMWAIDALAALIDASRGIDIDPVHAAMAPDFIEQLRRAQTDRVPQVAGWATVTGVRAVADDPQTRLKMVQSLASSPVWEQRLLAIVAGNYLTQADRIRVAKSLSEDPNDLVRRAAVADAELAAFLPVSEPTAATSRPAPAPSAVGGPLIPSTLPAKQ